MQLPADALEQETKSKRPKQKIPAKYVAVCHFHSFSFKPELLMY